MFPRPSLCMVLSADNKSIRGVSTPPIATIKFLARMVTSDLFSMRIACAATILSPFEFVSNLRTLKFSIISTLSCFSKTGRCTLSGE